MFFGWQGRIEACLSGEASPHTGNSCDSLKKLTPGLR